MTREKRKRQEKEKKKEINKKKKEVSKKKKFLKFFLISNTVIITTVGVGVLGAGYMAFKVYEENESVILKTIKDGFEKIEFIDENTFNDRYPTLILDANGEVLKEFKSVEYDYQTYDEINPNVFKALVAVEDVRFYEHSGIDLRGLFRAAHSTLVKEDVQGGSTITQQLAKNIFLTMDRNIWRKLEEMVIAQELEKNYTKEEILEFYVNNVNFANGCYSIESASKYYFNKETEDLNLSEIALLVGIPNNPSIFNPIRNIDNALERRDLILDRMVTAEYITEEDALREKNRTIELDVQQNSFDNSVSGNYALDYAIEKATESLMEESGFKFKYKFSSADERTEYFSLYNEFYAESRDELINGGYVVETSIDMTLQNKLQEVLNSKMRGFTAKNDNGIFKKQSSATVVNNDTGEVVAIVGGRGQEEDEFNRATKGARQPGSAIKPLVSYLQAFESGYTPNSVYSDAEIKNGPTNWYSGYKGSVNLRYATEISINTIPYRLTSEFGTEKAVSYLADMNFKYLTSSDFLYPIVAVGGFERGVTTVEMASGFSTIARNGNFIEPTNVSKITKIGSEDIVYENTRIEKEIYKSSAAYMMTDVLKGVISQGHGTGAGYKINYPHQAGKTGTTNSNYDYWFSGYTPYYSMAVWVGDDIPAYQNSSSRVAGSIWQEYMNYLHVGKEVIDFEMPNTVTSSNGILKGNEVSNDKLISDRQTLDKNRINREIRENQLRLDSEDYRIIHGLTLEEETWNQQYADDFLSRLSNFNFTNLEQESEYRELYKDAEIAVNGVKNKAAYEERKQRLSFAQINMNDKIQNLIYKIELDRLEAERLENERIERERLEAERLEQERLDALNPPVPEVLVPEITTPEVEEDIVIPESIVPENNLGGDLNDFDNVVNNEISSGGIQEQFPPE